MASDLECQDDNIQHSNGHPLSIEASQPGPVVFTQIDRTKTLPDIDLPGELWLSILESPCDFTPEIFDKVMFNLVKNPNVTSSHLFRADFFYDSQRDPARGNDTESDSSGLVPHLRPEFRPRWLDLPGWQLDRTIVRKLIPRNAQLDKPLAQTCHFLHRSLDDKAYIENLVVYLPHVDRPEDMPFYHPPVSQLAFRHRWRVSTEPLDECQGSISLSFNFFPSAGMSPKMDRTGLRLLQTVHKHGQGQLAGYEKRVHLDQIVPQKQYQDTYACLKAKYGKSLSDKWVEVTDPGKHVFEDIGIAAFLIELWRGMFALPDEEKVLSEHVASEYDGPSKTSVSKEKPAFPGFVDIGCGNGILVYILLMEGYNGIGFDARRRKTWSIFPEDIQQRLEQRLLVPKVLQGDTINAEWHDGIFPEGTFIVSNHADELTAWTPLLAYLNKGSFIAIPCCSHDLSGARFRAPVNARSSKISDRVDEPVRLPQHNSKGLADGLVDGKGHDLRLTQAAETGSLKRTLVQKKMASAYSTLCSYVSSLSTTVGFVSETEVLRIPSTRNTSIIGRGRLTELPDDTRRTAVIAKLLEEELGKTIDEISTEWIERATKLSKKPGSGH